MIEPVSGEGYTCVITGTAEFLLSGRYPPGRDVEFGRIAGNNLLIALGARISRLVNGKTDFLIVRNDPGRSKILLLKHLQCMVHIQ